MPTLRLNIILILAASFVTLSDVHGKEGEIHSPEAALWKPPEQEQQELIIKRMVYRQITDWTEGTQIDRNPVLSKNGQKIVFSEQGKPSRIFVMNSDGTEQREVDSFRTGGRVETDVSADGKRFVSTDSRALHVTDVDDAPGRERLSFNSDQIADVSISGDGEKVFFLLKSDSTFKGTNRVLKRGLYSINPNGSNLKQLVSAEQVGKRLDIGKDHVKNFSGSGAGLDASYDGENLVFVATTIEDSDVSKREWVFTVKADGTELRPITRSVATVYNVGISGDGSSIAFVTAEHGGAIQGSKAQFSGGKQTILLSDPPHDFTDPYSRVEPSQLNFDGSMILFGGSSILVNTDTDTVFDLDTGCETEKKQLVKLCCISMNNDVNRFLYLIPQDEKTSQLGMLVFNPERYAPAPILTKPKITPKKISLGGGGIATVEVTVDAYGRPVQVDACVYSEGTLDPDMGISLGLFDDGKTRGDKKAGDGVFTNNTLRAFQNAEKGARTIRIRAETRDEKNRPQTTVLEFGQINVVE